MGLIRSSVTGEYGRMAEHMAIFWSGLLALARLYHHLALYVHSHEDRTLSRRDLPVAALVDGTSSHTSSGSRTDGNCLACKCVGNRLVLL